VRLPDRLRDLLAADCAYPFSGEPC
jgi:hypothetical protein